jgi:hypothetical protein
MCRELDVRDFTRNRVTLQRAMELQSLAVAISDRLPGTHRITVERLDPVTGNAAHIVSQGAPPSRDGDFLREALDHVRTVAPAMGITERPQDFVAGSAIQVTTTGARAVQLRQRYKGIPVFQAVTTVRFASNTAVQDITGRTVAVTRDVASVPVMPVKHAVLAAARYVAGVETDDGAHTSRPAPPVSNAGVDSTGLASLVDLAGFEPTIRVVFTNVPERPTMLEPGPFGAESKASLVWFWSGDRLALGWNVVLTMPQPGQYNIVIDDLSGKLLYCRDQAALAVPGASPLRRRRNGPAGNKLSASDHRLTATDSHYRVDD